MFLKDKKQVLNVENYLLKLNGFFKILFNTLIKNEFLSL